MRPGLQSSKLRLAGAGALGFLALPVTAVFSAAWMFAKDAGPAVFSDVQGAVAIAAFAAKPSIVAFVVFVAPAWFVLQRFRASRLTAAATGAALGLLLELALVILLNNLGKSPEVQRGGEPMLTLGLSAGLLAIGAIMGGLAAFGMWSIAYPKEPVTA